MLNYFIGKDSENEIICIELIGINYTELFRIF